MDRNRPDIDPLFDLLIAHVHYFYKNEKKIYLKKRFKEEMHG